VTATVTAFPAEAATRSTTASCKLSPRCEETATRCTASRKPREQVQPRARAPPSGPLTVTLSKRHWFVQHASVIAAVKSSPRSTPPTAPRPSASVTHSRSASPLWLTPAPSRQRLAIAGSLDHAQRIPRRSAEFLFARRHHARQVPLFLFLERCSKRACTRRGWPLPWSPDERLKVRTRQRRWTRSSPAQRNTASIRSANAPLRAAGLFAVR
jgi:hypothetical protein